MKVFYHSSLATRELDRDSVYRAVPGRASLEIQTEKGERVSEVLLNGNLVDYSTGSIDIETDADLIIWMQGERHAYFVRRLAHELTNKNCIAYEQFQHEYLSKDKNEIDSIKSGRLKLYAVDQSADVFDWSETFDRIETAYSAIKLICEKPKSHLKAVNEVRPIDTVKRIGYESIPYLASHSEDWLARTASGLKPAKLFSRVEDEEYQIYENRVVKTLIDLILSFLRKKEKELKDQYEQLHGIINSSVQTGSFGFDVSFQKAVAELIVSDESADGYRSKALDLVEKLHKRAKHLLKKYRLLRSTRLYRYLKKTQAVSNPLSETNILLMDKQYSVVFSLWKEMHKIISPKQIEVETKSNLKQIADDYLLFCKVLCGYTAHVLNFEIKEDGLYFRADDNLELSIAENNGLIELELTDKSRRTLAVTNGLQVPIAPNESYGSFTYDGVELSWDNMAEDSEIDRFCSLFKTRESRGKEQADEKKKYHSLLQAIDQRQREYSTPKRIKTIIYPAVVELENDTRNAFRGYALANANALAKNFKANFAVIALPMCNEDEQRIVEYAQYSGEKAMILPLTMFDINSFRRLQNVFLRMVMLLETGYCPSCGKAMREHNNQHVCDNCYHLVVTKTQCPNSDCKQSYYYLSYDASEDTILKMQCVDEDNFFQVDSLYQYKDVVPMSIDSGKLRTICPCCRKQGY